MNTWQTLLHLTGSDAPGSLWYNFWSGFGSIIVPPILTVSGLVGAYYWHNHCKKCWRIARHTVDGTPYKTCHKHLTFDIHQELHDHHEANHPEQHEMLDR